MLNYIIGPCLRAMNAPAVLERMYKGQLYFTLKVEEMKEGGYERKRKRTLREMKKWMSEDKGCGDEKEEDIGLTCMGLHFQHR